MERIKYALRNQHRRQKRLPRHYKSKACEKYVEKIGHNKSRQRTRCGGIAEERRLYIQSMEKVLSDKRKFTEVTEDPIMTLIETIKQY